MLDEDGMILQLYDNNFSQVITPCFSQCVTSQYQDDRSTSLFTFAAALPILGNKVVATERAHKSFRCHSGRY